MHGSRYSRGHGTLPIMMGVCIVVFLFMRLIQAIGRHHAGVL